MNDLPKLNLVTVPSTKLENCCDGCYLVNMNCGEYPEFDECTDNGDDGTRQIYVEDK